MSSNLENTKTKNNNTIVLSGKRVLNCSALAEHAWNPSNPVNWSNCELQVEEAVAVTINNGNLTTEYLN